MPFVGQAHPAQAGGVGLTVHDHADDTLVAAVALVRPGGLQLADDDSELTGLAARLTVSPGHDGIAAAVLDAGALQELTVVAPADGAVLAVEAVPVAGQLRVALRAVRVPDRGFLALDLVAFGQLAGARMDLHLVQGQHERPSGTGE